MKLTANRLDNQELEIPNIRELIARVVRADSSERVFPSVTLWDLWMTIHNPVTSHRSPVTDD